MPDALTTLDTDTSTPTHVNLTCEAGMVTIEALMPTGALSEGSDISGGGGLPRFSMVAYTGDAMKIEGWRHPVVVDLDGLTIPSQKRPIRFAHSAAQGIGHTDRIAVDGGKLIAAGVVSRDTAAAREVVVSGKRGFPWQASIGAAVEQAELIKPGKFVTVNGRSFEGPIYVARKTTLGEISFVDLGADAATSASIAAQRSNISTIQTQDTIMPTTPVTPTDVIATTGTQPQTADTVSAQAPSSSTAAADNASGALAAIRAQALAETQRIAAVRRVCGNAHSEIEAKAITEGWTPEKCELEVLRASRPNIPTAPQVMTRVDQTDVPNQGVLEAACMLTAGLPNLEEQYDERTLELASKRYRRSLGLQELLLEAAWANGYTGRNFRDARNVLRFAFSPNLSAGFSTIDIGGILSNVANKFLLEGFFSVERVWRNICSVRNVSDFKTVTSYRLVGKDQYEQVAPGGELKHGNLGEQAYSNRADTYGLLLSIDRRDVINDDLGAITTVPRKLGRGSGLKINDVFWSTFLSNSGGAFFATGNKNYLAGADTVLGIDGLTKAEVAFLNQVDPDGKPIGVMPQVLLVPTALSAMGTMLFKSVEIRDTTASTKYPVGNPHAGKFRVEVSRYLSIAAYTGASDKAWYLLADPGDVPVIEVAFLNGQESPTIETAEADFNVLGVQMRGYHDFGVALQEPRGGVKVKGEA